MRYPLKYDRVKDLIRLYGQYWTPSELDKLGKAVGEAYNKAREKEAMSYREADCTPCAVATTTKTVNIPNAPTRPWATAPFNKEDYYKKECISLDDFETHAMINNVCNPPVVVKQEEKQKEQAMLSTTLLNLEAEQRNYLKRRLEDVNYSKEAELGTKFNMNYVETIKTLADAEDVLKRFTVRKKKFDAEGNAVSGYVCSIKDFFEIEPKVKADKEGFAAASVLLGKAYTDAKDAIIVAPLPDAMKALQDFEAKTIN